MAEAKIKDSERAKAIQDGTSNGLPLLHGIPISVKDNVRDLS